MLARTTVMVAAATLLSIGRSSGADEAKREPSAFLGKTLPDVALGRGRWVKDLPPPARADLAGKVVIVVTNSFL